MPVSFTPVTPIKITDFDYKGVLDSQFTYLGEYSFFEKWKEYWLENFMAEEEVIKDYMEKFPGSNPILQRVKYYPHLLIEDYEVFSFEHITPFGTIELHFDVESMKKFIEVNQLEKETINISQIYVNSETPVIQEKKQDHRIPYFVRMFGTTHSYVCVDGNKRMQVRLGEGQTEFEGYVFYPEHHQAMFICGVDLKYYILMYELNTLVALKESGYDEQRIYESTQMYLQSVYNK
ncbi:hypothetical protein DN401_27330 [Bacillus sp. BF2-3]|uniref:hypothetical protein n=1 Tax=Bacillus cereus group TaxID=86661 RepID=UPI000C290B9F|nr:MULTISPECIES: hypothetical protein [Bacillus cereus group]KAA0748524.1 hypothetical protein DN401_27330 [Bacillus sp. BF2-3]MCU5043283.1 hypothetical protein [Bacillus cereus]MDA2656169.1 hypothetical protein [Bacillus cereus]